MGAAEHVEMVLRTAVADAYRNAAAKVREKAAALGVGTPDGPVCDAGDLIRLAVKIDALATSHPKTVEEWWAAAQPEIDAVDGSTVEMREALRDAVDRVAAGQVIDREKATTMILDVVRVVVEETLRHVL